MLVIGDVVGHDGPAAARTGQLRGVLRTLAYDADGFALLQQALSDLGTAAPGRPVTPC